MNSSIKTYPPLKSTPCVSYSLATLYFPKWSTLPNHCYWPIAPLRPHTLHRIQAIRLDIARILFPGDDPSVLLTCALCLFRADVYTAMYGHHPKRTFLLPSASCSLYLQSFWTSVGNCSPLVHWSLRIVSNVKCMTCNTKSHMCRGFHFAIFVRST